MNTRFSRTRILMAVALVGLATGINAEAARLPVRDDLYRSAQLESHRAIGVAILPVAAVSDNPGVERIVEESWVALYGESRASWMPADEVRARLAGSVDDSGRLAREVDRQIWRSGAVEPEMAGRLARLLGVHAVLSVRVDRWEIADGGRAMVGMTAVLTDRDGTRLWSITGTAGYGRPPASVEQNFNSDVSLIWNPALERREYRHDLAAALNKLLARWAWSLPSPLYAGEEIATPLIAGNGEPDASKGCANQ